MSRNSLQECHRIINKLQLKSDKLQIKLDTFKEQLDNADPANSLIYVMNILRSLSREQEDKDNFANHYVLESLCDKINDFVMSAKKSLNS